MASRYRRMRGSISYKQPSTKRGEAHHLGPQLVALRAQPGHLTAGIGRGLRGHQHPHCTRPPRTASPPASDLRPDPAPSSPPGDAKGRVPRMMHPTAVPRTRGRTVATLTIAYTDPTRHLRPDRNHEQRGHRQGPRGVRRDAPPADPQQPLRRRPSTAPRALRRGLSPNHQGPSGAAEIDPWPVSSPGPCQRCPGTGLSATGPSTVAITR